MLSLPTPSSLADLCECASGVVCDWHGVRLSKVDAMVLALCVLACFSTTGPADTLVVFYA